MGLQDREWFQKDQDRRANSSNSSSSSSSPSKSVYSSESEFKSKPASTRVRKSQKPADSCPWKSETRTEPVTFSGLAVFCLVLISFIAGTFFAHFFL